MAMVIDNCFELGEFVYLKTDAEQERRIVTEISVRPTGILYRLTFGTIESYHYDIEISREVDLGIVRK